MPETLSPTDAPILLAGLIAARRCGDKPLASYFARELRERFGIAIRFATVRKRECREPEKRRC
jgi:hypothetical protein